MASHERIKRNTKAKSAKSGEALKWHLAAKTASEAISNMASSKK
jgi:hypothetical protein